MFLKKIDLDDFESSNSVKIEKVSQNLCMLSIELDKELNKEYYDYWRLTNVDGIPPLEIGLDVETGYIQTIVVFISPELFAKERNTVFESLNNLKNIIFDISIFKKNNEYIDIDKSYSIQLASNELHFYFETFEKIGECFQVDRVKFYIENDRLVGFSITEIDETEMTILNEAISV